MDNTGTRLSTLWVVVMFNMVFADILSFMYPGFLKEVLAGHAGGVRITPGFLLVAALLTEVPIAMIVLSRVLKRGANRVANIAAGIFHTGFVAWSLLSSPPQPFYVFFSVLEMAWTLFIVVYAWTWKREAASTTRG